MRETVGDGYRFETVFLAVEDIIRPARCRKPHNSDQQQGHTQRLHVGNEFLEAHRLPALVLIFFVRRNCKYLIVSLVILWKSAIHFLIANP